MFNKTKNRQTYYAFIYKDMGFGREDIGKRVLVFKSRDGEKARRALKRGHKGMEVSLTRVGRDLGTAEIVAKQYNLNIEDIGEL